MHHGVGQQAPAFANGLGDGDLALAGDSHRHLGQEIRILLVPPSLAPRYDSMLQLPEIASRPPGEGIAQPLAQQEQGGAGLAGLAHDTPLRGTQAGAGRVA